MPTSNKLGQLKQENLVNPEALRKWILKHFKHLYVNKEIPTDHLILVLGYIKDIISKTPDIDVQSWMSLIRDLEKRLEALKNTEK